MNVNENTLPHVKAKRIGKDIGFLIPEDLAAALKIDTGRPYTVVIREESKESESNT